MFNAKHLPHLLIPALAVSFTAGLSAIAGAAESAGKDPAVKHPLLQKRAPLKRISRNEETATQTPRMRQGHDGINNDAGVPPSGVPSETMNA